MEHTLNKTTANVEMTEEDCSNRNVINIEILTYNELKEI
jgi:hypothetical protein